MPRRSQKESEASNSRRPYFTAEGRENEIIALAYDAAEEQIRNGTASSQVLTHFLKMGAARERLEREILAEQKKLVTAKTETLELDKARRSDYDKVIAAMKKYSGHEDDE